jgi:hypothetical protein
MGFVVYEQRRAVFVGEIGHIATADGKPARAVDDRRFRQ